MTFIQGWALLQYYRQFAISVCVVIDITNVLHVNYISCVMYYRILPHVPEYCYRTLKCKIALTINAATQQIYLWQTCWMICCAPCILLKCFKATLASVVLSFVTIISVYQFNIAQPCISLDISFVPLYMYCIDLIKCRGVYYLKLKIPIGLLQLRWGIYFIDNYKH